MAVSDGEVREDSGGGGGGARLVRATFANVQAAVVDVFATFIDMQMACRDMQVVCRCFPDPLKIPTRNWEKCRVLGAPPPDAEFPGFKLRCFRVLATVAGYFA